MCIIILHECVHVHVFVSSLVMCVLNVYHIVHNNYVLCVRVKVWSIYHFVMNESKFSTHAVVIWYTMFPDSSIGICSCLLGRRSQTAKSHTHHKAHMDFMEPSPHCTAKASSVIIICGKESLQNLFVLCLIITLVSVQRVYSISVCFIYRQDPGIKLHPRDVLCQITKHPLGIQT